MSKLDRMDKRAEEEAIKLIKEGEGFKDKVYKCTSGYSTIGYGHKLLPQEKGKLN